MRHGRLIFGFFAIAGCASNPPPNVPIYEIVYDCSLTEIHGSLRLTADRDGLGWVEQVDGIEMQAHLSLSSEADRANFRHAGFSDQPFDHPMLFFDFPDGLKPDASAGYRIEGQPLENFFGGARGSGTAVQHSAASNVFLSLNWKQIKALTSTGDMYVFLYDRSGSALKTLHFARTHFDEIEQSLTKMYAEVLAREADKEHLCVARTQERAPDIILS